MSYTTPAFRNDFDKRVHEINVYFEFLACLKIKAILEYETLAGQERINVEGELVPILKANGFLLLYNLVESSCREAFRAIYDAVNNENMRFEEAAAAIQQLWIKQKIGQKTKEDTISKAATDMIDLILNGEIIEFEDDYITSQLMRGFQGNIDAQKIRKLATRYGFSHTMPVGKESLGSHLQEIKDKRQDLSHGLKTFAQSGGRFTEDEMIKLKENVVEYLEFILSNIETFLNQKHYKKTTVTP